MKKLILASVVAVMISGCSGLKQASKQNYDDTYYAINEKRPDAPVAVQTNTNEENAAVARKPSAKEYNGRYSSRFNRMGNTYNQGYCGRQNYNNFGYGYGNPYNNFYNPYNSFGMGMYYGMNSYMSMGWGMNPYSNFGYYNSPGYFYNMGYNQGYNNGYGNNYNNNNNSGTAKPKGLYMRRSTANSNLPSTSSSGTVYRPGNGNSIQNNTQTGNSSNSSRTSIFNSNSSSQSPSNSGNSGTVSPSTRGSGGFSGSTPSGNSGGSRSGGSSGSSSGSSGRRR